MADGASMEVDWSKIIVEDPKHPKDKDTPSKKPQFDSLLSWRHVDENPASQARTKTAQPDANAYEKPEDTKARLQIEADQALKNDQNSRRLSHIFNKINELSAGTLFVRDYTKRPAQLSATIILLQSYGFGRDSLGNEQLNLPWVIGLTMKAMAGQYGYLELGQTTFGADQEIIKQLRNNKVAEFDYRGRQAINQYDLDASVLTALAFGAPETAMKILAAASQVLPSDPDAANLALSRLMNGRLLDKVQQIYPPQLRARLFSVLASLGEGQFEGIKLEGQAEELKKRGERSLQEYLLAERDSWLDANRVMSVSSMEKQLEVDALSQDIEQAVSGTDGKPGLDKAIKDKAEALVRAKVANAIAQEIAQRMSSERDLKEQLARHKMAALQVPGYLLKEQQQPPYYIFGLLASGLDHNTSVQQRQAYVERRKQPNTDTIAFHPSKINFDDVIACLANPNYVLYEADRKNAQRGSGGLNQQDVLRFKKAVARKIIPTISFISTLTEDENMRAILKNEFGLDGLVEPNNLDRINDELKQGFAETVDPVSQTTLYESVLSTDQSDEDKAQADMISALIPQEIDQVMKDAQQISDGLISSLTDTAAVNLSKLNDKKHQLQEPKARYGELERQITALRQQMLDAENRNTVGKVTKLLHRNEWTSEEKAARVSKLKASLADAESGLAAARAEIAQIVGSGNSFDESQITQAQDRLAKLSSLKAATPAT